MKLLYKATTYYIEYAGYKYRTNDGKNWECNYGESWESEYSSEHVLTKKFAELCKELDMEIVKDD